MRDDPSWWALKDRVKARAADVCEYCRYRPIRELHHRVYERYGHEHDGDVMGVCRRCHRAIHGRYRGIVTCLAGSLIARGDRGLGMTAAWEEYLDDSR